MMQLVLSQMWGLNILEAGMNFKQAIKPSLVITSHKSRQNMGHAVASSKRSFQF